MPSLKQNALDYATRYGWHVHPVNVQKRPTSAHGLLDATCDPALIAGYFANGAQIGVRTGTESRVWVLDLDRKKGVDGTLWLAAAEAQHGALPVTVTQQTGSGGRQLFFRWPSGVDLRNSQSEIAPGVDVRGAGGYVVVAPSRNEDGPYSWIISPDDAPIADAPLWLIIAAWSASNRPNKPAPAPTPQAPQSAAQQAMQTPTPATNGNDPRRTYLDKALADELYKVAHAPDGQKHTILRAAAVKLGSLLAHGLDGQRVEDALYQAIAARAADPANALKTIRDGLAYGRANPRVIAPLGSLGSPSSAQTSAAGGGASVPPAQPPSSAGAAQGSAGQSSTPSQSQRYLTALAALGYTFKLNLLTDTVEVNGKRLDDVTEAQIKTAMRDAGHRGMGQMLDAITVEAAQHAYHPIRDYLNALVWDGGDHIAQLAACMQSSDPPVVYAADGRQCALHHVYLHRWLIGAVGKVFDGVQNVMLVLAGDQGMGKSTLAAWLCSQIDHLFIKQAIRVEDKDTYRRLTEKFIWEIDELDATTRRSDASALKSFITQQHVTVRRAYARHDTERPAVASLIGTFNPSTGILTDDTGNRRFLITTITALDWAYKKIDIGQLWAEATARYRAGESWQLTPEEGALQTDTNQQHEAESLLEGWITKWFSFSGDPNDRMSASDIFDYLRQRADVRPSGSDRQLHCELARVLTRLKISGKDRVNNVRYYIGIQARP